MTTDNITPQAPTLEELKAQVAAAIASGNDNDFMVAVSAIARRKAEIAKAQAEVARQEAEKLAGIRAELGTKIHQAIMQSKGLANLTAKLADVKAYGFTFLSNQPTPAEKAAGATGEIDRKSVALVVAEVKAARTRASTGGGAPGRSRSEYGMSLDEIYQKFKTPEDDVAMAQAVSNTQRWQVKNKVKNAAIKAGLLVKAA